MVNGLIFGVSRMIIATARLNHNLGMTIVFDHSWDVWSSRFTRYPSCYGAKSYKKYGVDAVCIVFLHGAGAPCHPGKHCAFKSISPLRLCVLARNTAWYQTVKHVESYALSGLWQGTHLTKGYAPRYCLRSFQGIMRLSAKRRTYAIRPYNLSNGRM